MDRWSIYQAFKSNTISALSTTQIEQMDSNELKEGIIEWILSK